MTLKSRILERIRAQGPMTVSEYMTLCLLDPVDGYYPIRDPLGADGDFITAPEISQMFGEMLGLWVVQSWEDLGCPSQLTLVEFGPGRGIMMSDMLRAIRTKPDCFAALDVYLIEASAALEAVQGNTLSDSGVSVKWVGSLKDVSEAPTLIIGNEYLDCLPIRQFIRKDDRWHERVIVENEGELDFAISPEPVSEVVLKSFPYAHVNAKDGDVLEVGLAAQQTVDEIAARFKLSKGRTLFIDYGPATTEFGDTLQALKRHEKVGVFSDPGNTDLTARVDFGALSDFAKAQGVEVHGPETQAVFLARLGIETRAAMLARSKPEAKPKLARQLGRLMNTDQMGGLFKAVCLQSEGVLKPAGFGG